MSLIHEPRRCAGCGAQEPRGPSWFETRIGTPEDPASGYRGSPLCPDCQRARGVYRERPRGWTVAELAAVLATLPPEALVVIPAYERGSNGVRFAVAERMGPEESPSDHNGEWDTHPRDEAAAVVVVELRSGRTDSGSWF